MESNRGKGFGLMVLGLALFSVSAVTGEAYPLPVAFIVSIAGWVLARPFRFRELYEENRRI